MSEVLEVIWLPEVEKEYFHLLRTSRDDGAEVGNQICEFLQLARNWNDKDWRPIEPVGSADLYGLYGRYTTMFFAISKPKVAVVKWAIVGTEYQQALARDEAKQRTLIEFP
jgi:hypothetical protein